MSLYIFPHHVKFQIYPTPHFQLLNIRMFVCVRNDGNGKSIFGNIKDRETDAIQTDGSFFYDQWGEFLGEGETELPAAVHRLCFDTSAGGIYMPLNHMPVEAAIPLQASFQIYGIARFPVAQSGFKKGFLNGGYLMCGTR